MAFLETLIGIIFLLVVLLAVVLLTRKWGVRFLYIVLGGFVIYVLSVDPGIGIGLSFIVIMSYLAYKLGDFKKKETRG